MAMDFNEYSAEVDEFISIVESEGYRLNYHDEKRYEMSFSPNYPSDFRSLFKGKDMINEIADEVFSAKWIMDNRVLTHTGEIIVKYTDLYHNIHFFD